MNTPDKYPKFRPLDRRQDAAITRLRSEATARRAGTLEACRYMAAEIPLSFQDF
jgi:hypothetical protein